MEQKVILIGKDAKELALALNPETQAVFAEDMHDAVTVALSHAARATLFYCHQLVQVLICTRIIGSVA